MRSGRLPAASATLAVLSPPLRCWARTAVARGRRPVVRTSWFGFAPPRPRQSLLRQLSQRSAENRRSRARQARRRQCDGRRRDLGKGAAQNAGAGHAARRAWRGRGPMKRATTPFRRISNPRSIAPPPHRPIPAGPTPFTGSTEPNTRTPSAICSRSRSTRRRCCPADDASHGFDNVNVGGLSPTLLDRYLSAAQKISPARDRQPRAIAGCAYCAPSGRSHAGRSFRRAAARHARRDHVPPHVSGGRRVHASRSG